MQKNAFGDNKPRVSTYFALMAEFGSPVVPLELVSEKYFGLGPDKARNRAPNQLPCPAFRGGSQRSKWLINLTDLADFIDAKAEYARREWQKVNQ